MNRAVGSKKAILIVDDEEGLANMLALLLNTRGYKTSIAMTANEAVASMNPEIDLVLLDLVLPDFNGFELCRRFKLSENTQHVPIIMLSARSLVEDRLQAFYLGVDDFLCKPVHHEELFARMEAVMRRGDEEWRQSITSKRQDTIFELRRILDQGLIANYFQPIYRLNPFELYGVEMLTRPTCVCPLSNPEHFFKEAMQYGLYTELETLSWSMAIKAAAKNLQGEKLFLNCDPFFIESAQFLQVKSLFSRSNMSSGDVVLEITERSSVMDFELFRAQLGKYRADGFQFAVDDVGGGYASLETIIEARPEIVKIDRKIVTHLCHNPVKQSVVKSIVSLCKDNSIFCVAEGVENAEELKMVKRLGVDAVQGYYLFRPSPILDCRQFSRICV